MTLCAPWDPCKLYANISAKFIRIMAVRVVEFSSRGTKLERSLHKNQHTPRNLEKFEFWINGELSKSAKI